jgi:hypothetical protein
VGRYTSRRAGDGLAPTHKTGTMKKLNRLAVTAYGLTALHLSMSFAAADTGHTGLAVVAAVFAVVSVVAAEKATVVSPKN